MVYLNLIHCFNLGSKVNSLGRNKVTSFNKAKWVELLDSNKTGQLVKVLQSLRFLLNNIEKYLGENSRM